MPDRRTRLTIRRFQTPRSSTVGSVGRRCVRMRIHLLFAIAHAMAPEGADQKRPPRRHPLREQLVDEVKKHPGSRLLDVAEATGSKRSTAKHHLGILEQVGLVKTVR